MLKHNRLLHKENDSLKEQNNRLFHLVHQAQQKVKQLSVNLQKNQVNVMPSLTVCNELIDTSASKRNERITSSFAQAGQINLSSPVLTLTDGTFIAAGLLDGSISLVTVHQPNLDNSPQRSPSSSLYRFSSEGVNQNMSPRPTNPLGKASDQLQGHRAPVTSLQWLSDKTLTSVSLDSSLKIWDIQTAKFQSIFLNVPAVSHTLIDHSILVGTCTDNLFSIDIRSPTPNVISFDEIVTSVAATDLGYLLGTANGKILLFDPRINKAYQSVQVSPAELPISKISGKSSVTITSFDGIVRLLGQELPLFVEKEYARAPINGSIIGSCCVSLATRDDFIISGSTIDKAIVWTSPDSSQTLNHNASTVFDCIPISNFVGSFLTCDNAGFVTMWARSFDQMVY